MANSPPFTMSLFLSDKDGRGWSETFHIGSDQGQAGYQNLYNTITPLRAALSPNTVKILRMRVQSAVRRSPWVILAASGAPVVGTYTGEQMPADVALLCRFRGGLGYYNHQFLRGVPEDSITGEEYTPATAFQTAFSAYESFLVGNSAFVIKTVLGTAVTKYPISALNHATPTGINMIVGAATTIPIGTVVYIHNAGVAGFNGPKTVVSGPTPGPTGATYLLSGANPLVDVPATYQPFYTIPTVQTAPLASFIVEGVSNRKAGRPFGVTPGRRHSLYSLRP